MALFGNNWNLWRLHLLVIALLISSCVGDPWPEPDTMEHDDPQPGNADGDADADLDNDADTSGEYTGDDTDDGTDAGGDADVDGDPDMPSDTEPDSDNDTAVEDGGTIIEDEFAHLATHLFVSAPDRDGWVTAVGLPGTIPAGRSLQCFVGNAVITPSIGLERGFAFRTAALPGDTLNCVVQRETENITALALKIMDDDTAIDWSGFIGTGLGAVGVNEGYIFLSGNGIVLTPSSLVIGANVSRFSAVASPTVCVDTGCRFELMIPGRLTDELDVFMVRDGGRATPAVVIPQP